MTRAFDDPALMTAYWYECRMRSVYRHHGREKHDSTSHITNVASPFPCSDLASAGTGTVSNSIIFTHSMGNTVFAAALKHGYCKLDTDTRSAQPSTRWCVHSELTYTQHPCSFALLLQHVV